MGVSNSDSFRFGLNCCSYLTVTGWVHLELYDLFIRQAQVRVATVSELESTFMKLRHRLVHV